MFGDFCTAVYLYQYVKTWKNLIPKFHFRVKSYEIQKNIIIANFLLQKDLQIWIAKFFYKMYIFLFNLKKYYCKSKIRFFNNNFKLISWIWNFCHCLLKILTIIYEMWKKRSIAKLFVSIIRSINFVWHTCRSDKTYIYFRFNLIYEKNVEMENYLPKWGLQILSRTFFDEMYILCFGF